MPLLNWKPEYSVNDIELDKHHQNLFSLLNTVYENVMNSPILDSILPIIDELSENTRCHFSAEEEYMREKGYIETDEHITKHREFTHTINKMKSQYHGNNLEVTQELIVLLGEWLLHHVLKDDMKYSKGQLS